RCQKQHQKPVAIRPLDAPLDHRRSTPSEAARNCLTFAAVSAALLVAGPLQPLQQIKTVSPSKVSLTGVPMEPSRLLARIGHVRWASAKARSAGDSEASAAAIFASGSSGVVERIVLAAVPFPLLPPK